jgi:hypothetical protein
MSAIIDFAGEAKKSMSAIPMRPVQIDPQLSRIEAAGGTIDLEIFTAEKIQKIVFCTINMFDTGVLESTAMIWPDDNHNLPVLWCNLTIVPEVMNVPVFDFIPMMDVVVWPEYAERYVACLQDLKDTALEVLGESVTDKAVNLPSLSVYTLSPYKLVAMITQEGIAKVPQVNEAYIAKYVELWQQAVPLEDGADKAYYLRKKAATSKLMKANDPGYAFMIDVFGEEKTHAVFDQVF